MFGNSAEVRRLHYLQFQQESEYRRMRNENKMLVEYLRCRNCDNELAPSDLGEIVLAQRVANSVANTTKVR